MTKPILWLGTSSDTDANFDPLLGRTAPAKAFVPSARSPVNDKPETVAAATPEAPASFEGPEALDMPPLEAPDGVSLDDFQAAPASPDIVEDWSAIVAWPVAKPSAEPVVPPVAPPPEPDSEPESGPEPEPAPAATPAPPATRPPLLMRLFSNTQPPPAPSEKSASINEIWAKSDPISVPDPVAEPDLNAQPASTHVEDTAVDIDKAVPTTDNPAKPMHLRGLQSAFDADGFWQLPNSARQEDAAAITQDIAPSEPEAPAADTVESAWPTEPEAIAAPVTEPKRPRKRKARRNKDNPIVLFLAMLSLSFSAIMTIAASAALLGHPFDMVSNYRWYLVLLALVSAALWLFGRDWKIAIAAFIVAGANLFVTMPASGRAPSGGQGATASVGWANVARSGDGLRQVLLEADKKSANMVMVAAAPQSAPILPAGWSVIATPAANDPAGIAVFAKADWRAATLAGEPTLARSASGNVTVLGVYPVAQVAVGGSMRDELINRAGARAGIQEGPTLVLGDFGTPPWNPAMRQFKEYSNVTRVRCGGWVGATNTQASGLIGLATDHAFVRDLKVHRCQLGAKIQASQHRPIWVSVSPKITAPKEAK